MIYTLLTHQWKSFWRSRSSGRNIAVQIFIGFIVLYLAGTALVVGFSLDKILSEIFPGKNTIPVFLGFILYYYAFDIIIRFIMQDLPTLAVQPYLTLNIKRKKLVWFLNIRSLFSIFSFLPLFLFLPFITTVISSRFGVGTSFALVVTIISLTLFNHFFVLFIKRKTTLSQWWLIGFFVAVLLVITADYFHFFSLRNWSASLFTAVINVPAFCLFFVLIAVAAYFNNNRFLRNNFYLENLEKTKGEKRSADYSWLQKFGASGDLIGVDIKLILRNKRPRTLLLISFIFLLYGFIFFKPDMLQHGRMGFILVGSIFITGMFMSNYGQYIFAWQSSHFDGLLANNISIKTYIKSKLMLLTAFSTISFLLSLLYGLMSWKIVPVLIAAWLFNIGIHCILTAFIGTRSYKAMDLSKSSSFNFQATGAAQWLYSLLILIIGTILYLPFALLINSWAGIAAIGILGLISLMMRDWWISQIVVQFQKQKYKMLEGFREK